MQTRTMHPDVLEAYRLRLKSLCSNAPGWWTFDQLILERGVNPIDISRNYSLEKRQVPIFIRDGAKPVTLSLSSGDGKREIYGYIAREDIARISDDAMKILSQ